MDRQAAIDQFTRAAMIDDLARQHLEEILKLEPLSVMFVVETQGGEVMMTSIPFSYALIRGLAESAFRLTIQEGEEDDGDGDGGDE